MHREKTDGGEGRADRTNIVGCMRWSVAFSSAPSAASGAVNGWLPPVHPARWRAEDREREGVIARPETRKEQI